MRNVHKWLAVFSKINLSCCSRSRVPARHPAQLSLDTRSLPSSCPSRTRLLCFLLSNPSRAETLREAGLSRVRRTGAHENPILLAVGCFAACYYSKLHAASHFGTDPVESPSVARELGLGARSPCQSSIDRCGPVPGSLARSPNNYLARSLDLWPGPGLSSRTTEPQ